MTEYRLLFKNKNFVYLWLSQILSQFTVNMMNFLLLTKLFSATGSSIATSLLWVTYALPAIFFGPIGAASVDFVSKRKMLMVTNLAQSLVVFSYFLFQDQSIFLLYMVVLAYSFLNQFYVPAESSSLPFLIKKENLASANSLFFITQQVAMIAGFGMGGIVERVIGFNTSILLCSIFLFIAFAGVSFLPDFSKGKRLSSDFEKVIRSFFASISEGYEFIKMQKNVLFPLGLLLLLQIYLAIIFANLPVIGSQILKLNVGWSGIYIALPAGIGAFLGSVFVPRKLAQNIRKKYLIEIGLLAMSISMIILSVGVSFIPVVFRVITVIFLVLVVGFGYVLANIPTLTFLQEVTPADIRGRVFGNFWFVATILTLFPVLFSGVLTEILGVKILLLLMGVGLVTIFYYIRFKGQKVIEENFK